MSTNQTVSRWLPSAVLLALIVSTFCFFSSSRLNAEDSHDHDVIHEAMEELDELFKELRKSVRDDEHREQSLETLHEMQSLALAAKHADPGLEPEHALAYRTHLIQLMRHLLDAEQAVLQGDTDAAFEQVKAIAVLRRESHEELGVNEH